MTNNIKIFIKKYYIYIIPLFILFIVFLALNLYIPLKIDDIAEKTAIEKLGGLSFNNLVKYLSNAYNNWSSRIGIGVFTAVFVYIPIVFKILNPFVLCFCCFMFYKILDTKRLLSNILIMSFIILLDFGCYYDAGVVPTNLNYLWPITFSMPSLFLMIREYNSKRNNFILCFFSIFSFVLLSFWSEQVVFCYFLISIFLILYNYLKNKRICYFNIIILLLCVLAMVNIFVCPGNRIRAKKENPELYNLPFLKKISRCIMFSCKSYCNWKCLVSYGLFILLILLTYSAKNKFFFINSIFSFLFFISYTILLNIPNCEFKSNYIWNIYGLNAVSIVFMFIFLVSITVSLIYIFLNDKKIILILLCYVIGNFSIAFTGFSDGDAPSRICLFSYFASTIVVYKLFMKFKNGLQNINCFNNINESVMLN